MPGEIVEPRPHTNAPAMVPPLPMSCPTATRVCPWKADDVLKAFHPAPRGSADGSTSSRIQPGPWGGGGSVPSPVVVV